MSRKKEEQFRKEYFAMKRRLLRKGYGLLMTYRLIENAFCQFYGKRFTKKMLKSLREGSGDFSA